MKKILMFLFVVGAIYISCNNVYARGPHDPRPGNWSSSNGKSSQDGDAVNVTSSNGGNTITLRCMPSSMCCYKISDGMLDINPPLGAQNEEPADPMGTTTLTKSSTINLLDEILIENNQK